MSQGAKMRDVSPPASVWIFNFIAIFAVLIFMAGLSVFNTDFTSTFSIARFILVFTGVTGLVWLQTLAFNEVYEDYNSTNKPGMGLGLWLLYGFISYLWYVSFFALATDFSVTYLITWGSIFMLHAVVLIPAILVGYVGVYLLWS